MVISNNHEHHPHDLRGYLEQRGPVDTDRFEVKIYAFALVAIFLYWMLEPGLLILGVETSGYTVAAKSVLGHQQLFGLGFILAGLLGLPLLWWVAVRRTPQKHDRLPRKLFVVGAILGAVLYWILASNTKQAGLEPMFKYLFGARMVITLYFGFLFARSLNSQTIREKARDLGVDLPTNYEEDSQDDAKRNR